MESQTLFVLGVVIVIALLGVVAFALATRRTTSSPKPTPQSQQWVAEAKIEAGERPSALVSEEIEELVRAKLAAYPDLANAKLDFATGPDGSLEIQVHQTQYHSVNEIPDQRLAQAIQAAVQEWNERKGG
jgi:hypothetical protein